MFIGLWQKPKIEKQTRHDEHLVLLLYASQKCDSMVTYHAFRCWWRSRMSLVCSMQSNEIHLKHFNERESSQWTVLHSPMNETIHQLCIFENVLMKLCHNSCAKNALIYATHIRIVVILLIRMSCSQPCTKCNAVLVFFSESLPFDGPQ